MTQAEWDTWSELVPAEEARATMRIAEAGMYGNPYLPDDARRRLWASWQRRALGPAAVKQIARRLPNETWGEHVMTWFAVTRAAS